MRFVRLGYLLPRLLVLGLVLLATEVGSGYFLRWGIISGGEAAVGARVEVGKVKSSLLNTRVAIAGLAVANPNSPMKNLAEADRIEIDFNTAALLRKKLVADYGIVSGLEFSTPRTTSGALPETAASELESAVPEWAAPLAEKYAAEWLTDLESRLSTDVRAQFQSVRLAEEMAERWPSKYRKLEAKVRQIRADAKQLEQQARDARKNPLRHVEFLSQLPQQVEAMHQSLRDLHAELAALPTKVEADRRAVLAAREHDEARIRAQLEVGAIDAKSLTNYLLGEKITGPVSETMGWIRWARRLVPPVTPEAPTAVGRGEDIVFAGAQQLPDVLVRAVRLEGRGRMGGRPVDLVGVVRDWTTQPMLHAKPTTFELTTSGGLPLKVTACLDRTRAEPRDRFVVESTGLVLPELELGTGERLQLAVAPSTASLHMNLRLDGEELTGDVIVAQQGLQITPTVSAKVLGGRLQEALTASVKDIDQSTTTIVLTGTIDRPQIEFDSTLGGALAAAIERAATDVARQEGDRLVAKGQREVDAQLAKLTGELGKLEARLASELAGPGEIIASLLKPAAGGTELGRSPFGQFFK